jgi:hypothetical protein
MDIDSRSGVVAKRWDKVGHEGSSTVRRVLVGLVVGGLVVGPLTYMAADREPPFVRLGGSVEPDALYPGDWFTVRWDMHVNYGRKCVPVPVDGAVKIRIIDAAGAYKDIEPQSSIIDAQNIRTTFTRRVRLPMGLVDGPARYHSEACFACNIVQYYTVPICIIGPDLKFTILKRED